MSNQAVTTMGRIAAATILGGSLVLSAWIVSSGPEYSEVVSAPGWILDKERGRVCGLTAADSISAYERLKREVDGQPVGPQLVCIDLVTDDGS